MISDVTRDIYFYSWNEKMIVVIKEERRGERQLVVGMDGVGDSMLGEVKGCGYSWLWGASEWRVDKNEMFPTHTTSMSSE